MIAAEFSTQPAAVQLPVEESSDEDLEAREAYRKFKVCFRPSLDAT